MSKYKFLIVGAGPAGLCTAILLARSGHHVILISREKEFVRRLCGEYLSPTGVELMRMFRGVLHGYESITGMRICASGYDISAVFPGHRAGVSVIRGELETRLYHLALASGAEISLGESYLDSGFHEGIHHVKTSMREIHCDFLIGADGRKSMVARRLNLADRPDTSRVAIGVIAHTQGNNRLGEMHLLSNSTYLGIDPNSSSESNLSVVVPSISLKDTRPSSLLRKLLHEANQSHRFQFEDSAVQTTTPVTHRPKRIFFQNGCLLGDAAGFADPITGEGMTMALRSAHILHSLVAQGTPLNSIPCIYAREHNKILRPKFLMKPVLDTIVTYPAIQRPLGQLLTSRPTILQNLLGLIGQIYSPGQFLKLSLQNLVLNHHERTT